MRPKVGKCLPAEETENFPRRLQTLDYSKIVGFKSKLEELAFQKSKY